MKKSHFCEAICISMMATKYMIDTALIIKYNEYK